MELHGAHGYLINQFLGSDTNRRSDHWGGTFEKRCRFLFEIIQAIRRKVPTSRADVRFENQSTPEQLTGSDNRPFLIVVRISPERNCGVKLEEMIKLSEYLRDIEIDSLHLSCWDIRKTSDQKRKAS